jgi:hypothetical protein
MRLPVFLQYLAAGFNEFPSVYIRNAKVHYDFSLLMLIPIEIQFILDNNLSTIHSIISQIILIIQNTKTPRTPIIIYIADLWPRAKNNF